MPVEQSIIIGIHGLAKKLEKPILTKWWKAAICEGLNYNTRKYKADDISPSQLNFSMVYWNDLMGENRILTLEQLNQSKDHYQPANEGDIQSYKPSIIERMTLKMRIKMRDLVGDITEVIVKLTGGKASRRVMEEKLKDLHAYYNDENIRTKLQKCLKSELEKHKDKRIMLISHSMGTIIAYDVLCQLASEGEELTIEHFITMGSPLGLPFITERIQVPRGKKKPAVPDNVKKWTNFSDMSDPVCADPCLADDYESNKEGVGIVDQIVLNDWPHDSLSHKSYGYLRTPEVSKATGKFIGMSMETDFAYDPKNEGKSMASKVAFALSFLLLLIVAFILVDCTEDWHIPIGVAILGLSGGLIGAIQKYKKTTEEEQSTIAEGLFRYHYMTPALIGGNFALVLMLIFAGDFSLITVNSSIGMFPKFSDCLSSKELYSTLCSLCTNADLAKLYVWSFIAGYSSRLVPTIIRGIGKRMPGSGSKSSPNK